MQMTIDSYMQIISAQQKDENTDLSKLRQEIALMQQQIHDSERQRHQAVTSLKVVQDEHKDTLTQLKQMNEENARMKDYIEEVNQQMGVPKSHYDQLLTQFNSKTTQYSQLEAIFSKTTKDIEGVKLRNEQLSQELHKAKQDKIDLQSLIMKKDSQIDELSQQIQSVYKEQQLQQNSQLEARISILNAEIMQLKDDNDALVA